ncbi:hypothetical protein MG293_000679 [Ovis ammon polii]|uniref:Solute carrier family 15 member 2 n=1 Tax=Ovis ammon polii TaxID=230172 RepID=A0AAD4YHB1_OVIAM|nr:hypothetical protein MG293_000679 [Ovis ammon polii]
MNPFQKNDSKETLFLPVSTEEVPPQPPSFPKKPSPKICGSNYPLSIVFIVVNEFCERFSYYGMKAVLTLYFLYFLHWSENTSTSVYHAFSSLCYFTPILGAAIADSWLGKFKTIIYLSLVYVLGHVIKSMGALPILGGQMLHTVLSMVGLSLIALGTGGIKPCVAAFGGDQFEEKHVEERTRYFSVFYLSINAGSLISTFVTPMLRGDVQCFGKDCYALAFGVPGLLMLIALVVFAMGSKLYRKPPPEGNILNQVVKCIWFAISSRFKNRSGDNPKREHWLDWAAEKYPKQLIMDVKALTRVLFLYIPLPMFWALLDQQGFFVLQPDQMQVLNPFLVLIFIPLFDLVIYRVVSKCGINFTSLRKMAVGMILACLAFAVAAAVEIKINEMAPYRPDSQEIFLQVLNLADDENMPHYSKLHLKTKSQNFHFQLKYHNVSVYTEHSVEEKIWYTLIIREDGESISSMMVKDEENKTTNGMIAMRFVNTLHEEVNVSLGTDASLIVAEDYGVSAYRTVQRGEYPTVHCRTKNEDFSLNLGLLDFGAVYLFVITNAPSSMKSVLQAAWLLTVAVGNIIVLIVAQFSGLAQWAEFILFSCLLLVVCLIFSIMGYYYVPLKPGDVQGYPYPEDLVVIRTLRNTLMKKICGSNYPLSIVFIVVNEFCERFSYYGMKAVLTLYFLYYLNWSEATSTSVYHAFSSLCYFTPILGAAIADSWLGKFKVLSMVGLSLIALGTGGIKPCVAAFGGDQFEEKHFAISSRFKNRSGDNPKREHWLDWAAEKYPKQLIMDVKALTRVLFLYIPLPMFWALFDQQGSRWTLQATRMNGNLVLSPFLIVIFIPLFDLVIYRLVSKCGINFTSLRKMTVGMILACLGFAVAAAVEIKINEMATCQPNSQEIFLQVLNLADDEVKVTVLGDENNTLLAESIKSFQNMPHYSKLHLKTKSQNFHFQLKYHNVSVYTEHPVEEKMWYTLIIREDGKSISSMMVKDEENKTTNGMTAMRFVNTLHEEVSVSLGTDASLIVAEDYGVSAYRTVQRGEYPVVHCRTKNEDFSLNLGLLDFGTAYLFVITNAPSSMKSIVQAAWLLTIAFGNIIVLIVAQFSGLAQWAEFIFFSCLMLVVCLIFSIMGYYHVPLKPEDVQGSADKQTPQIQGNMINLETKKTRL